MEEKRGYGKNGRNEGYKGASRGGRPTDSRGPGTAVARGPRTSDFRGGRPTDARGPRTADERGPRSSDFRGGRPTDAKGPRTADARGPGTSDFRGDRPTDARGPRTADERGPRTSDFRGGRPTDAKGPRTSDARGPRSSDFRGSSSEEYRGGKPGADRFDKPMGPRGGRPSYDRSGWPADTRGPRHADDRYGKPSDARGSGSDSRGPRADDSYRTESRLPKEDIFAAKEEKNPAVDDFAFNQGDLDKLEGRNSVLEALKSGRSINRIFVSKGDREGSVNQIVAMARESHILIQEIDRAKLDAMSVTHAHQGVIALTAAKDYVELDDILASAVESGRPPFLIILDEITDSHNLGSILRTANAAGVHGVIIPKRRAIGLTSVVSKASAGAIEYVPVARVTNIVQTIESLKKQNIWVVGTDSSGDQSYFDRDLTGPIALVVGSEGEGMGKLVRESCDFVVNIPMMGQISSLNAAVAGAIVTYEILRQRSKKQL